MGKLKRYTLIKLAPVKQEARIFFENFLLGLHSLWANKLRSFLSLLGIIIGIASVITVTSIGQAASSDIKSNIESIGTRTIMLMGFGRDADAHYMVNKYFTPALIPLLKEYIPEVADVTIDSSISVNAKYQDKSDAFTLKPADENWLQINNYNPAAGRFINEYDANRLNAVIGYSVYNTLFGGNTNMDTVIGQKISITYRDRNASATIVGVMPAKTRSFLADFDNEIYVDASTYKHKLYNNNHINRLVLTAARADDAPYITQTIDAIFKKLSQQDLHKDVEFYRIISQQEMLQTYESVTSTLSLLLGGIAAIALVVGGIGIMNIMLVSVSERTKEVGLRKALGAKNAHIFSQFLIEASLISVLGGIAGTVLGIALTAILVQVFKWQFVISVPAIFLALAFSILIGDFFGFYPARRAARLNPVDALRYE
jgi:putative ABC transport system permease protein